MDFCPGTVYFIGMITFKETISSGLCVPYNTINLFICVGDSDQCTGCKNIREFKINN